MSEKDSHPIRNGVIIAVVGSLLTSGLTYFSPPFLSFLKWLWGRIVWTWGLFAASYAVPGWVLLALILIAGVATIRFCLRVKAALTPEEEPWFKKYTSDDMYGAIWRWEWSPENEVKSLWCYCPICDGTLVYRNPDPFSFAHSEPRTRFFCEHCNHSEITAVPSSNVESAKDAVLRELHRRLRIKQRELGAQTH